MHGCGRPLGPSIIVRPLISQGKRKARKGQVREGFDCGKPSLNDFVRSLVGQYEKRNLGRTFYERFGFMPLTDDDMRLFLPLSTIRSAAKP